MGKPLKELLSSVYSLVAETIDKINQDTANPECAKQLRRIGRLAILGAEKAEKLAVKENPAPVAFDITRYFSKETAEKVAKIVEQEEKAAAKREADRVRLQEKRAVEKAAIKEADEKAVDEAAEKEAIEEANNKLIAEAKDEKPIPKKKVTPRKKKK